MWTTASTRPRAARRKKCPTQILSVLVEMENVTAKVVAATAGLQDAQANQARKQELSKLEAGVHRELREEPAAGRSPASR